jgi:hydroxymethylbilane synthase
MQTRLARIERGEARVTMLAQAGLNRLGLYAIPGAVLPPEEFLPAIAQGAIGIECRENDSPTRHLLAALAHTLTEIAVTCERSFLRVLDGSCRTPIAGYATIGNGGLQFRGLVVSPDGRQAYDVEIEGGTGDAEALGIEAGMIIKAKMGV